MYFELGNDAFDKGDFEKAVKYYNDALESEKNIQEILQNLSLCYYEVKDYSSSIDISNKLISSDNSSFLASALFNRGNCYHKMKEYRKAEEDFSIIISIFPYDPDAYYNRSNAREKLNNALGAKKDRRIVEIIEKKNDQNLYAAPSESEIDSYTLDQFTTDKTNLLKEIETKPDSYSLYFELGNAYAKIREFKKAIEYFNKSIELYSGNFYESANQNLIAAYLDICDYEKAISVATKYIKYNPDVEIIRKMKKWAEEFLDKNETS